MYSVHYVLLYTANKMSLNDDICSDEFIYYKIFGLGTAGGMNDYDLI